MDVRVISIGALAEHALRGDAAAVRTGHATTTLIRAGDRTILVDPGLPPQALAARLEERTGLAPAAITHVFLTCFRPDVRRGLGAFEHARWWLSETEREGVGVPMAETLRRHAEAGDRESAEALRQDVALLSQCEPAPDELAPGVSLFPLPGVTPGLSGVLIAEARHTLLICGDAIPTVEHLERGQVLAGGDLDQARSSFSEAVEIADLLILGRDNLVVNPTKRPF